MSKRFLDANWTTFALFAVLALTLIAIVAVPTRRVTAHRPAHGRAAPAGTQGGSAHGRPAAVRASVFIASQCEVG
jgi:hypothetical protein